MGASMMIYCCTWIQHACINVDPIVIHGYNLHVEMLLPTCMHVEYGGFVGQCNI